MFTETLQIIYHYSTKFVKHLLLFIRTGKANLHTFFFKTESRQRKTIFSPENAFFRSERFNKIRNFP